MCGSCFLELERLQRTIESNKRLQSTPRKMPMKKSKLSYSPQKPHVHLFMLIKVQKVPPQALGVPRYTGVLCVQSNFDNMPIFVHWEMLLYFILRQKGNAVNQLHFVMYI